MSEPKKPAPPTTDATSPFAKLAGLREQLPPGASPTTTAAPKTAAPKKEKPLFLEKVVVRFTRKGHGGKTVTVVTGVAPHALEALCTEMKKGLGCGARVEDGAIVLQGELVDRAVGYLEKKGAPKIVRGS